MTADSPTPATLFHPAASAEHPPADPDAPAAPAKRKREKRPRRQWKRGQSAALLGYLWLALVGLCVGAMSWTGLVGFARDTLGLTEPLCYGVPISLDGAAITLAFFALRAVLSGGAAGLPRLLAVVVVVASSAFNVYHAEEAGQGSAAAVFFGGMSVLVYVMFEVVLRHLRREHLAELGAIEPPLARFRLARWVWFPWRTLQAWRVAVDQGLTDPRKALDAARKPELTPAEAPETPVDEEPKALDPPKPEPTDTGNGKTGEAREAVRRLLDERGGDVTRSDVLALVSVSSTRAGQLLREEKAARNGSTPQASKLA